MQTAGFSTILCPVDFSELSAQALRHAAALAKCGDARIVAAYANWFEAPPYFTEGRLAELESQFRESMGEAEHSLKDFVKSTLGDGAAAVDTRVVDGLPADAILDLTESTHAGLVVMGTHGRTGFNHWMLGSVTERILRESPVPLLTVRGAPTGPIRRILCPIDGTDISRHAFRLAAGLGACFGAVVTALYVSEGGSDQPPPDICDWIPAEERQRCRVRELVRHGDPAEEIIALASAEECDLIVLGAPRRRFFEGMVLGTTTLRAVRHAPCPVLTVSGPRKVAHE
jgi:nucleotide-binding universal stress UspA family protein